ncbi:Eco57I restriction-modification methylase domain-containing protein [bacterium]|nr:Eco57I restriction-modification methylase domain-containing protein [bacterium]
MNEALEIVRELVSDFRTHESKYLAAEYQESQVRQDFINKLFDALGWDVNHVRQKNPYEQEVQIEEPVKTGGSQRRADYAFYIAPNFRESDVRFFVEAKKPSRSLNNADDYHQIIRYGWHKNHPIGVLTDFEEFHIIDCRYKPDIHTALNRKIKSFHYSEYTDEKKFSEIFYLFGREAVAAGSIQKFALELPKPKGRSVQTALFRMAIQTVDEAFLEDLDGYRERLAKAFKKENQELDGETLTEVVQRTIDRLVFIRFLEDKGIEEETVKTFAGAQGAWKSFIKLGQILAPKYNGLVFKSHELLDSPKFRMADDSDFSEICFELSGPQCNYHFDQIPVFILGSIYERFLGKVVRATEKRVKVEEKPEVRKAGGVYYTPEYIVRYIVQNTVGKMIEGKTPEEISEMAFADIACGSGSFLIEVYTELLEYHRRYYAENSDKITPGDTQMRDGKIMLTLKKKHDILLKNIYGVDIDFQATEVTQLSLYLKLLEDVTMNDAHQFNLLKEKILPDLKLNIVCGNSLIGTDIFEGTLFGDADTKHLRPMNFKDYFPEIMKRGGFDAIVGNPPYVRIQNLPTEQISYLAKAFTSVKGNCDLYVGFVEQGFKLLQKNGFLGYILPNKFFTTDYGEGLRSFIAEQKALSKIVNFGNDQVFSATTYSCLLFLAKQQNNYLQYSESKADQLSLNSLNFRTIDRVKLDEATWLFDGKSISEITKKMFLNAVRLLDLPAEMSRGSSTGDDEVFIIENGAKTVESEILREPIFASDFNRYVFNTSQRWKIIFPYFLSNERYRLYNEKDLKRNFPKAYAYLHSNISSLKKRKQFREWFGFSAPRNLELHDHAQIIVPLLADKGIFALIPSEKGQICPMASGGFTITISDDCKLRPEYVLGLLNSKLLFWLLRRTSNVFRGGWITCTKQYFGELPIYKIDFKNSQDKSQYDHIVELVERMLAAKQTLSVAKVDAERTRLEVLCESLDRQIDEAVYKLYGLNEEEIAVVEDK